MLPTLVEARKGSASEDSGYAPFSGAEQKVETGTTEGAVGRTSGTLTPLDMMAFSLVSRPRVLPGTAIASSWGLRRPECRSAASTDFADRARQLQGTLPGGVSIHALLRVGWQALYEHPPKRNAQNEVVLGFSLREAIGLSGRAYIT